MNRKFPYTDKLPAFQKADDNWSAELIRLFGRDSGQARWEPRGRGEEGSILRLLYDARERARAVWHRSAD